MKIASIIAFVFYVCRSTIRRNVSRNLEALGTPRSKTFDVFRFFSKTIVDFLGLDTRRVTALQELCRVSGLEHLDAALEEGNGAILFTSHQGPWEVAGAFLASKDYRIHSIALDHPSPRVTGFFSRRRSEWGISDYPVGVGGSKLFDALRANEIVVLLVDRRFSTKGMPLSFLGRRVRMPRGHVRLSKRTGAPLIPCCCSYTSEDSIEVVIHGPIRSTDGTDEEIAQICLDRIESFLRSAPEQWFAFDHLWPEGEDVR